MHLLAEAEAGVGILRDRRQPVAPPVIEVTAFSSELVRSDVPALQPILALIGDDTRAGAMDAGRSQNGEGLEKWGQKTHHNGRGI